MQALKSSPRQRTLVIGGGVGGLACAIRLAAQGREVLLLERAASVGGKLRELSIGGLGLDAGPTVLTMRWVLDALFQAAGRRLEDHLTLQPLGLLARHAWSDGSRLDLHADRQRSAQAIGEFAGAAAARGYLDFCDRARAIYRALEQPFLRAQRPNPVSLVTRGGAAGLPGLLRISPFTSLWGALGRHFADPRLRQLFGRYATYCGSSPFSAPATLMLVAHVEQDGVWQVAGGMRRIAEALAALATACGVTVRCNAPVEQILVRDGRACGVRLASGETLAAQTLVFNGDAAALGAGRPGIVPAPSDKGRAAPAMPAPGHLPRSLSALTWNLVATTGGLPLSHHTVCFSDDYRREFDELFGQDRLPSEPSVYVCAQDRGDGDAVPGGPERLLLIVNAPARGDAARPLTAEEIDRCETQTFRTLARCGLQVSGAPALTRRTTPADFERLFPATGGALYGPASHGWRASFRRAGARSRLPGLYLAGGSTHPGPGLPMAMLSGALAAQALLQDLARTRRRSPPSMHPSPPAATPGGTSTR